MTPFRPGDKFSSTIGRIPEFSRFFWKEGYPVFAISRMSLSDEDIRAFAVANVELAMKWLDLVMCVLCRVGSSEWLWAFIGNENRESGPVEQKSVFYLLLIDALANTIEVVKPIPMTQDFQTELIYFYLKVSDPVTDLDNGSPPPVTLKELGWEGTREDVERGVAAFIPVVLAHSNARMEFVTTRLGPPEIMWQGPPCRVLSIDGEATPSPEETE
jgi:hypothetical protein